MELSMNDFCMSNNFHICEIFIVTHTHFFVLVMDQPLNIVGAQFGPLIHTSFKIYTT